MPAALGVRTCPELACGRRIYISPGGTVYARCLDHTLAKLRNAIRHPGSPSSGSVACLPPVGGRPPRQAAALATAAGSRPR